MVNNIQNTYDVDCCLEEIGATVQRLVRVFQLFERDQIKVFGFTSSQCYALLELYKGEGLSMNEISAKMNLDTSTMTRVISNLVRDGLVERTKDESDRRYVLVKLTEAGCVQAAQLKESIEEYYRQTIANIPAGQVFDVLASVQVLLSAFEKANPHCC